MRKKEKRKKDCEDRKLDGKTYIKKSFNGKQCVIKIQQMYLKG